MANMDEVMRRWRAEQSAKNKPSVPTDPYSKQVHESQTAHESSPSRVTADKIQISWKAAPPGPVQDARERLAEEGRNAHKVGSPDRITADSKDRVSRTDAKP